MPLYVTVFLCGASLMGLELAGARILAPAMGNSIFVWGSVISSFMLALSVGYFLGGIVADRFGTRRTLGVVVASAGVLTVVSPLVVAAVLPATAELGPRLGPLTATTIAFFGPALLLAMVSPIGVRAASASGLGHIGRSAGSLYAVSTGGSIVGTLATSFWLIPALQTGPLIVGIGILLACTAVVTLALPVAPRPAPLELAGRTWTTAVAGIVVLGLLLGSGVMMSIAEPGDVAEDGSAVLFRRDTQYHRILVTEAGGERTLRFDRSRQTSVDVNDPVISKIRYPDYLHLAFAANPGAERVLVLGLGGGALPARMLRDYPQVRVDSVEIDPVVVDVAERFFALPEDERLRVYIEDARRYVQRTGERYDIIVVDCYHADALPFHLTTQEFFEEIDDVLEPGGVVAYNIISAVEGERSDLFRSLYRTTGTVWDHLWVFPVSRDGQAESMKANRNIVLLATDTRMSETELLGRIGSRVGGRVKVDGFDRFGESLYRGLVEQGDVPVLTDTYAPTDSLIRVN
ncbi:MAG: fused MFS/spermidine synthase [Coriobacteriia bacterium]|nr:fused MFS/spermidine synthase [Coriobacteriia bacterium]